MATLKPPGNIYGVTTPVKPLSAHEQHMNHLAQIGATQQQITQANNYNKAQNNKISTSPNGRTLNNNTGVVNPTQTQQQANPTYNAPDPFSFNYNYLNYDTAKNQAEQQFNPLYEQSVNAVKAQQYQNNLDSGQSAAVRGLAHSGLAQDALTKIAIATQGQISGLNAQKMSDVAKMAQDLVSRDQDRGDRLRSQMFNEYASNRDFGRNNFESDRNYGLAKSDQDFNHMNTDRYYNLDVNKNNFDQMDRNRNFGLDQAGVTGYYNGQRTEAGRQNDIGNSQWNQQFKRSNFESDRNYNRGVLESDREWNQMSPAEKMRMAAELSKSLQLKKASGGGGGGSRSSSSTSGGLTQKGSQNLNIDPNILMAYYNSMLNSKAGNANVPYSRDPNSAYMRKMQDIANG